MHHAFLVRRAPVPDFPLGSPHVCCRPCRCWVQVSFEFMNQQLLWHGFSEFMLFLLPLIDFDRLSAFFGALWSRPTAMDEQTAGYGSLGLLRL